MSWIKNIFKRKPYVPRTVKFCEVNHLLDQILEILNRPEHRDLRVKKLRKIFKKGDIII
jgi:hypothetical protein